MKTISVFNNKGGVGKTTLTYHLSSALANMGKRVLLMDFDPQCNLTLYGLDIEDLHDIWAKEDDFIEDFAEARSSVGEVEFGKINNSYRTVHYLLKPIEDELGELEELPPPINIGSNLDLIPGRLTLHKYEQKIAESWPKLFSDHPAATRAVTQVRELARKYAEKYNYDFVLLDTSPNLGALNKVIISTVDGFVIPCLPDMFSLYGIRNIGSALSAWKKDFDSIYRMISSSRREKFPKDFVRFLGFTIYNAKKYTRKDANKRPLNDLDLAQAAYNYAKQIPDTIKEYINEDVRRHLEPDLVNEPIGHKAVMHMHNTFPLMAQKYRTPIWNVPDASDIDPDDLATIRGNQKLYRNTLDKYQEFTKDFLRRVEYLDRRE